MSSVQNQNQVQNKTPTGSLFERAFVAHPDAVGETYAQHMMVALGFSGKLFLAAMAALIHAIIPALFETTASERIASMYETMKNRHPHS